MCWWYRNQALKNSTVLFFQLNGLTLRYYSAGWQ